MGAGLAERIPKLHKQLWFGIASRDHGHVICAADLTAASLQEASRPPVTHIIFDDMAGWPKDEWRLVGAHAVHLGAGKFFIASEVL
ncbi:hypothetical protein BS78_02G311300 [Paspalum vaginatum]|nr:hypothetical protein BS78_02G311300 [Paspalum vaginatum]